MKNIFKDKIVLITGGTGSFGNAFLKSLLQTNVKEIRVFSRDEKKQNDMRINYNNNKLQFIIGDVRSYESINNAMINVDYVFCAAALKQVPSCEFYPIEAIRTNIFGIENTIRSGLKNHVDKIVVLSTDKAVHPINAMGMSKALAEKVSISIARKIQQNKTKICITRYGNVMGSRGSVIPLFIKQIKSNKKLTITDPEMTRFMMSLDEAVNLVLFAFNKCNQGDIFVQKSPSTTIQILVDALLTIFEANNKLDIVGTRHAEKKHEILLNREELNKSEDLKNYFRVPLNSKNLNYEDYFDKGDKPLSNIIDYSSNNTKILTKKEVIDLLLSTDFIKNALKNNNG